MARDPFTGATLDSRYRLDGIIGRGGMATVYRAEDVTLGRRVAVKVFAETAEGIDDVGRRRSETALLASLSHRALVHLYDAAHDEATGREFLVMELVEGEDLRHALARGPFGASEAAFMLADLGEALHVIHERGIVHRDVKPANVLLEPAHLPTRSWNAKLADFGIARLIDDSRLTRTGLVIGTPGYLSPEQVGNRAPGPAGDVYSLGLLVLEARTGEPAFPGTAAEAAGARLVRDPEIPERLGADWVDLLRAMTSREPADRPAALDVALAAAQLGTSEPTAPTIALATAPSRSRTPAGSAAPTGSAAPRRPCRSSRRLPACCRRPSPRRRRSHGQHSRGHRSRRPRRRLARSLPRRHPRRRDGVAGCDRRSPSPCSPEPRCSSPWSRRASSRVWLSRRRSNRSRACPASSACISNSSMRR